MRLPNSYFSTSEQTELDRRLAEDDASPNDTVAWETIKAEAQARWNSTPVRFVMQPDEMSPKEALERIYQLKKLV